MENFTVNGAVCECGENAESLFMDKLSVYAPPYSSAAVMTEPSTSEPLAAFIRRIEKRNVFIRQYSLEDAALHHALSGGEIRCLVGIGSKGADLAKKMSVRYGLPYILIAAGIIDLRFFSGAYQTEEDGYFILKPCAPPQMVAEPKSLRDFSDAAVASLTGEIVSLLVKLFDLRARALLFGTQVNVEMISRAEVLIARFLKETEKTEGDLRNSLVYRTLNELASLEQGIFCLYSDSAQQTANAIRMLFRREERNIKSDGENKFIISGILLKTFLYFLSKLTSEKFTPPPDNNLRMEKISEYFGIDPFKAPKFIKPYLSPHQKHLLSYKMAEYRDDLLLTLTLYAKLLKAADKPFRRTYGDGGYSFLKYLDSSDISICMALAPDIGASDNFLTILKYNGFLDKYIY